MIELLLMLLQLLLTFLLITWKHGTLGMRKLQEKKRFIEVPNRPSLFDSLTLDDQIHMFKNGTQHLFLTLLDVFLDPTTLSSITCFFVHFILSFFFFGNLEHSISF